MCIVSFPQIIPNPRDGEMQKRIIHNSSSAESLERNKVNAHKVENFHTVNLDSEAIRNYRPKRAIGRSSYFEYAEPVNNLNHSMDQEQYHT